MSIVDEINSGDAKRMSARAAIRDRIENLRKEADGLEALLKVLDPKGEEDFLTPQADEAIWRLIFS